LAVTVMLPLIVAVHTVVLTEVQPVHEENVLAPAVAGAVRRYVTPAVPISLKLVVPCVTTLLLGCPTPMTTPLAGFVELTVRV